MDNIINNKSGKGERGEMGKRGTTPSSILPLRGGGGGVGEKKLLKWIKWGIILTIFTPLILGPFGISLSNWPKTIFFRVLVEIVFILYLWLVYIKPKYFPRLSFLLWANIIFFGVLFLSALTGVNFYRSFFGELYRAEGLVLYLHFLIFLIVATAVFSEKHDWIKFLKITVAVSALSSFAGMLQKIGTLPFYNSNPFSFYGLGLPIAISGTWTNPDFFAPYIVLNIFLGFYILTLEKNKRWKYFLIFISVLNVLALILSGCRAGWIGFGAGIIFFFAAQLSRLSFFPAKAKKVVLAGFLLLSITGLFIVFNKDKLSFSNNFFFRRAVTILDVNSILYSGRLAGWKIAVSAWQDRPILGWGPESYSFLFDKYLKKEYLDYIPENIFFDRPHNKALGIMATSGTVGILAYIGLFATIFYYLIANYSGSISRAISAGNAPAQIGYTNKRERAGNLFLMALFISYFVQNLFIFDNIGTYFIFFIAVGFINNFYSGKPERGQAEWRANSLLKAIIIFPLIAVSVLAIYSLNLKPTFACRDFVKGVYRLDAKDYEGAVSYFYKGMNRGTIFDGDFQKEFAERTLLLLNGNALPQDLAERILKILSDLRVPIEKSLETPDRRIANYYKMLAIIDEKAYLAFGDENDLKEMERILKKAVDFNKEKAAPYQLLGVLNIYRKNFQQSEYFFQKFFDLGGGDRISIWRQMGVVYARTGEMEKAVENFKKYLIGELAIARVNRTYSKQDLQRIFSFSADLIKFHIENFNDRKEPKEIVSRLIEAFPEYENWINANLGILL